MGCREKQKQKPKKHKNTPKKRKNSPKKHKNTPTRRKKHPKKIVGSSRARDPQADKNDLWRAFLKRDFATEPQPTYPKTNPTDPGRPGFAPTAKKSEKGPKRSPRQCSSRANLAKILSCRIDPPTSLVYGGWHGKGRGKKTEPRNARVRALNR